MSRPPVMALPTGPIPYRDNGPARTRNSMVTSVILHVLLFAFVITYKPPAAVDSHAIEVTMLDPGEGALSEAATAPSAPPAGMPAAGAPQPMVEEQRFRREMVRGDVEPVPMNTMSLNDQITSRLASLRETGSNPGRLPDATPSGAWGAPANVPNGLGGGGTAPQSLSRGGSLGSAPSLSLHRGGSGTAPSSGIAPSRIATTSRASEPTAPGRDNASRNLAGAQLLGPVADRPIVHVVTPEYPEWAKKDGVEGAVTLHFIVRADGSVKENVLVQRTAGFEDFDENARVALRAWRFQPLSGGRTGEQWGTITFHYRLRDAG